MSEIARAPDVALSEVEWRVQGKIDRGDGVTVVPYLDAPTVSGLLDAWVGPARWRDHYEPTGKAGSMWCYLSVRFDDEWVTKEDLGTASDMEADKGLVSDAFKRVAMRKWRVGANVFDLPILRITKFDKVERPNKEPAAYLNGQSATEIKQRLTSLGFDDAAEQTKVVGAEPPAETAPDPEPDPVDLSELEGAITVAQDVGLEKDWEALREWASQSPEHCSKAVAKVEQALADAEAGTS